MQTPTTPMRAVTIATFRDDPFFPRIERRSSRRARWSCQIAAPPVWDRITGKHNLSPHNHIGKIGGRVAQRLEETRSTPAGIRGRPRKQLPGCRGTGDALALGVTPIVIVCFAPRVAAWVRVAAGRAECKPNMARLAAIECVCTSMTSWTSSRVLRWPGLRVHIEGR